MDFIVHNYYKISSKPSLQFYWLNRNRKFIMKYEEVVKEGNNGIFQLPTILTGKYSLALDGYIDMVYSIRVGDKIEHNDNGKQIYFEINVDEVNKTNKIKKYDNKIFISEKVKINKGIQITSRKHWGMYWNCLHLLSFNYPDKPTDEDKNEIIKLTKIMMDTGIQCRICKSHFIIWNSKRPIQDNCNSREELKQWYIDLHNDVNAINKKKMMDNKSVEEIYRQFDNSELEKYNLDVLGMFKERRLSELPKYLNNVVNKQLWKEHDIFQE